MLSRPVLAQVALLVLLAASSLVRGAEPTRVQKFSSLYGAEFEAAARSALGASAERSLSLREMVELHKEISSRGGSRELRDLSANRVRTALSAPDLEKRFTLSDGIDAWQVTQGTLRGDAVHALTAVAVRKLAAGLSDEALKNAFLEASPAAAQDQQLDAPQFEAYQRKISQRSVLFWLLSDRWIERELAKIQQGAPDLIRCPDFQGNVPREISDLPPECIESWKEAARAKSWLNAKGGTEAATPATQLKPERSDAGAPNFEAVIDRFFKAPGELSFGELSRFYWTSGFWCGTGGEAFGAVQARMALLLQLRDRNLPSALKLMLTESSSDGLTPAWQDETNWRLQLIKLCGLDWEKLLSSTLLPYQGYPGYDNNGRVHCSFAVNLLASRGSDFAGKVLLAVQKQSLTNASVPNGSRPAGGFLDTQSIRRFITPGDVPPGSQPEIAREIQGELLQLLLADLRRDKDYIALANSLVGLAHLKRPEIKEAIRPLLESRFNYVRQNAAEAMSLMGEDVPRLPRGSSNARFRIMLNDRLWSGEAESVASIQFKTQSEGWHVNHSILAQPTQTNEVAFDHDRVLQAMDRMTEARLVMRASYSTQTSPKSGMRAPWFVAPLKLPISLDETNEVRVQTQPLLIRIKYPRPLRELGEETVAIKLEWLDAPKVDDPQHNGVSSAVFTEPVREEYAFAALQQGRYRVAVTAPGSVSAKLDMIEVKPGMEPLEFNLGPGVTVRAKLNFPEFNKRDVLPAVATRALHPELWMGAVPIAKLLQNGKEVASATFARETRGVSFSNVPPGKYQLRVLGPKDFESMPRQNLKGEGGEPATGMWKRAEITVEVRRDSPAALDAGEIKLMKTKLSAP